MEGLGDVVGGGGGEGDAVAEEGTFAAGEGGTDCFGHFSCRVGSDFCSLISNEYLFLLQGFIGDIISLLQGQASPCGNVGLQSMWVHLENPRWTLEAER